MKLHVSTKIRRFAALAAVALSVSATVAPTVARSEPNGPFDYEYYSDDTYTVLVGEWTCGTQHCTKWGEVTPYVIQVS